MKTKTKSTAKKTTYGKPRTSPNPGKRIEDRDLNDDDQNRITNAEQDSEDERYQKMPVDDVEKEEEREKKRRAEDARGENES